MADTQRQCGCRVWLQNTAQQLLQIRVHIVLDPFLMHANVHSTYMCILTTSCESVLVCKVIRPF